MVLHETTMENSLEFVWLCMKTCRKDSNWICLILQEIYFRTIFCMIITDLSGFACNDNMDLSGYARNVIFCNGKTLGSSMLLHESMMYTDVNHNGLHTGTDISEITKSGFVCFCKKAPHM